MTKSRSLPDDLWGRPITEAGADVLARRYGYRFAGYDTQYLDIAPDRFMAVFFPEPDRGESVVMADGRTRARALRRGIEACKITRAKERAA